MIGGVAASAAVRTFPFRVFSFPTNIKIASPLEFPEWMYSPVGYLYDKTSKEELARFMGTVEKDEQGFKLITPQFHGKVYPAFFEDGAVSDRLFSDEDLAKVNWA